MKLSRRDVLAGGLALPLMPTLGWAQTTLSFGDAQIDTLSDGHLILPGALILQYLDPAEAAPILAAYGQSPDQFTPDCNVTLLRMGDRTVLFDVGAGPEFMATAGKLHEALDAAGVAPEDVTDVVFTHAHPDHLWGLLDDFGDLVFPDAAYHMGRIERDYWTDPNTVSTIGADRTVFAVGAASRLAALADQIEVFEDGAEIVPGVAARMTPGHTPGHMSFLVQSGSDAVMILGDCIANPSLAFARPDWWSGTDQDPDLAATTRTSVMDQLATDQMRLIGYHLPDGGIGRAERRDGAFVFVPEV